MLPGDSPPGPLDAIAPSAPVVRPAADGLREGRPEIVLNPKTALFFLAFLPQFVDPARGHVTLQILQLGILFALMGGCSDSVYAVIAGTVAERIRGSLRLRRAARSWANILCKMREPFIGVLIGQGGGLDRIQIVYQLGRKIVLLLGGVLWRSSPRSWRLSWFLSLSAGCGEENESETG